MTVIRIFYRCGNFLEFIIIFLNMIGYIRAWWHMSVIPATWEIEAGGL
jgi:hypothetical protein